MILTYNEAIQEFGSDYKLSRAVAEESVYKQENGIYSTRKKELELGIIMKKYRKGILTGEYAYYIHDLTNVIPEKYDLATSYRRIIDDLELWRIQEYAAIFPKSKMISKALDEGVL